ncbi:MAG: ABC transporter ATP-binding protein [Gammaproteobacteria bacterium]|nr:ABC transporter ATP-binding protein [Gammaproteobacteria bacterium]
MFEAYRKIYAVLDGHERKRAALLLVLFLARGLMEMVGIASIMPFISVAVNPGLIESNAYLASVYAYFGFTSHNQFLLALGIVVFVALVSTQLVAALTEWFLHRFNQMCDYRLSMRLLKHYFSRPYSWFLNQHSADLGRTVVAEVQHMVAHAVLPATRLISRLAVVVFLIALIIIADPWVALAAMAVLGSMYSIIYFGVRRRLQRIGAATWETNKERFQISQEALAGIKEVKVSGLERAYLERYRIPAERHARYHANQRIISMLPKYVLEIITFGGILAIVIAFLTLREGGLEGVLPVIALFALAGYRLMPALQIIYHDLAKLRFGAKSLERIHAELVESRGELTACLPRISAKHELIALSQRLELVDVSFTYPAAHERALQDINVSIPAGSSVAFVGTTGAGKTTAVDIILGLLEPDSGALVVDGVVITKVNRRAWQRSIGYVPQAIYLIDDTLAANIAFGQPPEGIDMEAVERAARIAELHDFICTLPDGYSTKVGERGVRLSGGQRQRIGIARALYHDPNVVILDEATSALDNVTEQAVMSAVENLGQQKTIIMIAHRLSTVRKCDTIFLLEHGQLVDAGTYDELTQRNEGFREIARLAATT